MRVSLFDTLALRNVTYPNRIFDHIPTTARHWIADYIRGQGAAGGGGWPDEEPGVRSA